MVFNSWVELVDECPINLERLHRYAQDFESKISVRISINNLNKTKTILLDARGDLDMMFTSLIQLFRDKTDIEKKQKTSIFDQLKTDFSRFIGYLDTKESDLMIKFDEPNEQSSRVGVSRLSAYAKELRKACNSIIYETLFIATKDYKSLEKEDKSLFVYLFFDTLQDTISVLGGEERRGTKKIPLPARVRQLLKQKQEQELPHGKEEEQEEEDDEEEDEEETIEEEEEDVEMD